LKRWAKQKDVLPTLPDWRGNPFGTRQRPVFVDHATLARRQCIPTLARGNEKKNQLDINPFSVIKSCL